MRVTCGRRVRVGPGDRLVVVARLHRDSKGLGRLFVFARAIGDAEFSPYVPNVEAMPSFNEPKMLSPMALRLTYAHPQRQLEFVSDIDGWVRLMQEVDGPKDPRCRIKWRRTVSRERTLAGRLAHWWRGWRATLMPVTDHG